MASRTDLSRAAALALLVACALPLAHAEGVVEVRFTKPQEFSDAGRGTRDIEHTVAALGAHLQGLATRLPAGQRLQVEVMDVDLAGDTWPARWRAHDVRVLRGRADWPSVELKYTLSQDGRVLKSGQQRVSDMNYLFTSINPRDAGEFAYERRMLTRWVGELTAAVAP
jgi:hypothetical protein